jgi:predicted DsbA family dithiol-disulfide isomerase
VRIEQLRREFDLQLRWTVFPLHPETPETGVELSELLAGRGYDLPALFARLQGVATELGLPWRERTHTYNSRRAQELGKWAETLGRGEDFHAAVYRAYFGQGRNIARPDELAALAESLGLSGAEARQVLEEGRFAAAVDADWERTRRLGVSAVPSALWQGRALVGFQPYAAFRQLVGG